MAKSKIGFHMSTEGNRQGWGDHVRALDAAGIPAVCMTVGGEGLGDIAACWENGSEVDHVVVVRYMPPDGSQDVPRYGADFDTAVNEWLDWYCPQISGNVATWHHRVITKHGNELDKNELAWLCGFYRALHPALLARMGWNSHRICCFSFATGEPEPEQWEQPAVLDFLRLAGDNPDKFVIGLHEYSLVDDLASSHPHQIGRFQRLLDVCDRHGIKRPHIAMHEFGWRQSSVPSPDVAIAQLHELAAPLYARYSCVLGAGIWTLQNWPEGCIPDCAQALISPLTEMALNNEYQEEAQLPINDKPLPPPKHGLIIDVSGHNRIDWDTIQCTGALVRASNGINKNTNTVDAEGVDRQFWHNLNGLQNRKLPFGIYHFYNENSGVEQIPHFLRIVEEAISQGFVPAMGLWLDFEETSPTNEAAIREGCEELLALNSTNQPVGIYTRASWWNPIVPATSTWPSKFLIWVANWVGNDPVDQPPAVDRVFLTPHHWQKRKANVWQFTSKGGNIVGHDRPNLDVNYWFGVENIGAVTPDPTGEIVNVLSFIRGTHRRQFDKEYKFTDGTSGTQTTQIWHLGTNKNNWLYIKGENGEYERLGVRQFQGEDWIFRFEDTSEGPERYYAHFLSEGGKIGAPWVPCQMEIGRWYETAKFVQHYRKGDNAKLNSGNVTDRIRLMAAPASKTYASGKMVENVIVLQWAGGEEYDFADGNIAFRDANRDFWFMDGLEGRPDKAFAKPAGIDLDWNF